MCGIKRKIEIENWKNYLEATQVQNKTNYLEKIKLTETVSSATKENIKSP